MGLIFLKARWREPLLDSCVARDVPTIKWDGMWSPKLELFNVRGEAKQQIWKDVQFSPEGEAFALEKRRIKGVFSESMELAEFPFDIQDLSLLVTSDHPEDDIDLEEDEEDMSNVVTHSFVDESEWHLKKFVATEKRTTSDEFEKDKYKKPGIFFRCCVIRRAGFFVWNIMLIMSIISALSFVTFAVSRELPQNRIQLSFILLLAGVTFKFAASQSVPKISYLTHLDRYILGSMVFLFLVACWHGTVTRISDSDKADLDYFAFIGFIVLYIVLHITFILIMVLRGFTRRSDVRHKERDYLKRYEETHTSTNLIPIRKRRFFQSRRTNTLINMRV